MAISYGDKKFKSINSLILHITKQRPVAYIPALTRLADNLPAGILLSQLLYWKDKGHKKDWIFKTIKELREETGLSRSQQDIAISKWEKMEVLEVKLRGIPPKRHFRINLNKLLELQGFSDGDIAYINNLICKSQQIEKPNQAKYYIEYPP